MTSPVDTSVKYFSSLMAGAPVLSGTVGAMIGVLDACLKDGFDTKTLTSLVAAGGVMTATWASGNHSSQTDAVVLVAGVSGGPSGFAGANGEQKVLTRPTNLTATWATALPDGTYTGTITMKMAPLGFAKIFSGTNLAAYQSTDPQSTKMLLRVDDSVAATTRVRGFESMSDINTGVGPFPTDAQMSGGGYWGKSNTANSTAVQWMLIGDSRCFYLHVCPGYSTSSLFTQGFTKMFGDIVPFKPSGDAYGCVLSYSVNATASSQSDGQPEYATGALQSMPRAPTGLGSAQPNYLVPYTGTAGGMSGTDSNMGVFPSPIDGSLRLSKRYYATATTGAPPRGDGPGIYTVPQSGVLDSFNFGDRIPGSGLLAGKNLIAVRPTSTTATSTPTSANTGATFFDVTGPWR